MGIKKKILDAMDIFLGILREKTLQTLEEVDASTTDGYWAGAGAVAELNNKLAQGRVEIVVNDDDTLGYKLDGADAVIPFRSGTIRVPITYRIDVGYGSAYGYGQYSATLLIDLSNKTSSYTDLKEQNNGNGVWIRGTEITLGTLD